MQDSPQNRAELASLLMVLSSAFPNSRAIDDPMVEAYWFGLNDLALGAVKTATSRAIRESRFFPSVAELRSLAGAESLERMAVMAWDAVRAAKRAIGSSKRFVFDDPAITATVANLGGCDRFHNASDDDLNVWLRKEFERVYMLLRPSAIAGRSRPLDGAMRLHEAQHPRFCNGKDLPLDDEIKVVETGLPWACGRDEVKLAYNRDSSTPRVAFSKA